MQRQTLRQSVAPQFPDPAHLEAALCALVTRYMAKGDNFGQAFWCAEMERDNNGIEWRLALNEVNDEHA